MKPQIFLILLFSLMLTACAHHRRHPVDPLRDELFHDWIKQSENDPQQFVGLSTPTPASMKNSACGMQGLKSYQVDQSFESLTWQINFFYCPDEGRYWANEIKGMVPMMSRWTGPYKFGEPHPAPPPVSNSSDAESK